jgi:hypothetical protein
MCQMGDLVWFGRKSMAFCFFIFFVSNPFGAFFSIIFFFIGSARQYYFLIRVRTIVKKVPDILECKFPVYGTFHGSRLDRLGYDRQVQQ